MGIDIPERTVWQAASDCRALDQDHLDVWLVELDRGPAVLAHQRDLLSSQELARAARFHFEMDRRRFIVARATLRFLLGRYLGQDPVRLEFAYNEYGKPALIASRGDIPLCFNVSHSDGLGLIGMTLGRPLGIDIERIRGDLDIDALSERFLSIEQSALVGSALPEHKAQIFFQYWTQLEAWVKASGATLDYQPLDPMRWTVRSLDVDAEYSGAHAATYAAAYAIEGEAPYIGYWKGELFD